MPVSPECGIATDSLVQDAHSCDRTAANISHVSARFEEGTTVPDASQAEMSYGPRRTDTSDCSRIRAHTREHIGQNAISTSAALDEGAPVQAAHCVAAAIEEGTTVPAGTQAETCVGRRSADKSGPPVLRFPELVNAGARQSRVLPPLFRHWALLFRGSLFTRASAPANVRIWVLHVFMWIPFFLTPAPVPTYLLLLL